MDMAILTPKVEALFQAVDRLMAEGADINRMTVAQITDQAGIGKGTAYEYFQNKEELIAGALLYRIDSICREVMKEMDARGSFREKVCCLLDAIDQKKHEKTYLLKIVNIATDTSSVSNQMEKMVKENTGELFMPENILDHLLESARDEGWRQDDLPIAYIKLNVASKLLAYTVYSLTPPEQRDCEQELLYRLVCDGICSELKIYYT